MLESPMRDDNSAFVPRASDPLCPLARVAEINYKGVRIACFLPFAPQLLKIQADRAPRRLPARVTNCTRFEGFYFSSVHAVDSGGNGPQLAVGQHSSSK